TAVRRDQPSGPIDDEPGREGAVRWRAIAYRGISGWQDQDAHPVYSDGGLRRESFVSTFRPVEDSACSRLGPRIVRNSSPPSSGLTTCPSPARASIWAAPRT